MLCNNSKLAMTSSTPGKTKLVNHFLINDSWYLVDLPGYGYAKMDRRGRDELRRVIDDYILGSGELACLFVLVDSRHDIGTLDVDFIRSLGEHGIPFAIIFTKTDKIGPVVLERQIAKDSQILGQDWEQLPPMFVSSSQKGSGREEILSYIEGILKTL
jgi:GTP-binding protein